MEDERAGGAQYRRRLEAAIMNRIWWGGACRSIRRKEIR